MTLFTGPHSLVFVQFLVGLFYVIGLRLSAATTDETEKLLVEAVIATMHRAHCTVKEMAHAMKIDRAQLERQLRLEPGQHLSLRRLIHAPFAFWCFFGPSLMQIVFEVRYRELADELKALTQKRSA